MDVQIKVELIKSETIKPSSPTPEHLRSFKFSLIDQIAPFFRTPVVLFYPSTNIGIDKISKILKNSMSRTLKKLYPLAGRLRDNLSIDCNDAGVEFSLARVHSPASKFLEKPDSSEILKLLIPMNHGTSKEAVFSDPLLIIRASFFDCGAISICVRVSHKIADADSIVLLLKSWSASAASSLDDDDDGFTLHSKALSLIPPSESLASAFTEPAVDPDVGMKRLVFHGHAIAALRSRLASPLVPNPSRVEAVLALLWNALIALNPGSKSAVTAHVNIRKIAPGSFPGNHIGNAAWIYVAESDSDPEAAAGPKELVVSLRRGYEDFKATYGARTRLEGVMGVIGEISRMRKADVPVSLYSTSSLCRFPWYETDFGWGKPSLVCFPNPTTKNVVLMLDSRDGDGIDVWLSLSKEDMQVFERNYNKLLSFSSIIPSA